mmetsp:Transcript_32158/g.84294  ORF Transcript_32158/g.84294 Transcript_32158/m.84294 type:complete len:338 (-) Transcript_32158:855-1868(-)
MRGANIRMKRMGMVEGVAKAPRVAEAARAAKENEVHLGGTLTTRMTAMVASDTALARASVATPIQRECRWPDPTTMRRVMASGRAHARVSAATVLARGWVALTMTMTRVVLRERAPARALVETEAMGEVMMSTDVPVAKVAVAMAAGPCLAAARSVSPRTDLEWTPKICMRCILETKMARSTRNRAWRGLTLAGWSTYSEAFKSRHLACDRCTFTSYTASWLSRTTVRSRQTNWPSPKRRGPILSLSSWSMRSPSKVCRITWPRCTSQRCTAGSLGMATPHLASVSSGRHQVCSRKRWRPVTSRSCSRRSKPLRNSWVTRRLLPRFAKISSLCAGVR